MPSRSLLLTRALVLSPRLFASFGMVEAADSRLVLRESAAAYELIFQLGPIRRVGLRRAIHYAPRGVSQAGRE
jgi:hypothetical protein